MQPAMCNQWIVDSSYIIHRNRTHQRDLTCFGRSFDDSDMCPNGKRSFGCFIAPPLVKNRLVTYRHIRTAPRVGCNVTKRWGAIRGSFARYVAVGVCQNMRVRFEHVGCQALFFTLICWTVLHIAVPPTARLQLPFVP